MTSHAVTSLPHTLLLLSSLLLLHSSHCLVAPSSWQRRLDKALLDIDATPESRFRNFQKAVKDPTLRTDVTSAIDAIRTKGFGKGHPELINILWPTGTMARSDLEGLTALRTQLPEALKEFPELVKTSREQQQGDSKKKSSAPASSTVDFNALPKLEDIKEELKNALRSTPKGLETPNYSVVRTIDGELKLGIPEKIEIRKYEAFTVATTPSMGGTGFQTLASYLFGGNEEKKAMAMTMPVFVTGGGTTTQEENTDSPGTMKFVIPSAMSNAPPAPLSDDAVNIERVPERLVAVKAFPGLVTEEEVLRQTNALLAALVGGNVNVLDGDGISVLQYNSPLTIPWRRRNEIAVVVEDISEDAVVVEVGLGLAWSSRTVATSWYDAGLRLYNL